MKPFPIDLINGAIGVCFVVHYIIRTAKAN